MNTLPPHDIDAEEAVLGSIVIDGHCFGDVNLIIKPDDFYDERNRILYAACLNLYERRDSIDQVTLANELDRMKHLQDCGGSTYLSHLVSIVPTSIDAEYYADIVRRLSINRMMIVLANKIQDEAYKKDPDTNTAIDNISELFTEFKKINLRTDNLITPEKSADALLDMINQLADKSIGIPYGFKDLDRMTAGMFPGELTIIGGDSGTGKTELMMNIMDSIQNKKVLFVSAEMRLRGLLERKVARKLKIDIPELRRGELDEKMLNLIQDLVVELAHGNIYVAETTNTSRQIYALVERMKQTIGVDIVFVDYLQRLKDAKEGKQRNDLEIGMVANNLKTIANDFEIPVVCISSFNRDYKNREDKTPRRSDLRGSGEIEFEADNIYLVYRNIDNQDEIEKYGNPKILRVKLDKGRQVGIYPSINLVWNEKKRRYVDYTEYEK